MPIDQSSLTTFLSVCDSQYITSWHPHLSSLLMSGFCARMSSRSLNVLLLHVCHCSFQICRNLQKKKNSFSLIAFTVVIPTTKHHQKYIYWLAELIGKKNNKMFGFSFIIESVYVVK